MTKIFESFVFFLIVIFFFPYLMMTSIIKPENETITEYGDSGGVMKSYDAQNNATKSFQKHMVSIVFAVIVTLIIFAISNQTAPALWK